MNEVIIENDPSVVGSIAAWQNILNGCGYSPELIITGWLDEATTTTTKTFQADLGLSATGEIDLLTWQAGLKHKKLANWSDVTPLISVRRNSDPSTGVKWSTGSSAKTPWTRKELRDNLIAEAKKQGLALKTQWAYMMATIEWETANTFEPVREAFWLSEKWIIVAPGFGDRGIDGKIFAARYARERQIPFLGICLGMQCAVVEFARNVLGYKDAHSTEMDKDTRYPVIDLMEEQKEITDKGGTMRLGAWDCKIKEGTRVHQIYGITNISERHRHRFEFNNAYLEAFEKAGFIASGINPGSNLVEIMELTGHPWFIGVQFHPEYSSTVMRPHPLFIQFVKSALNHSHEQSGIKEVLARK